MDLRRKRGGSRSVFVHTIQWLSFDLVQVQQTQQSVENSFVEVSFESGCAEELDGETRRADEWPHNPGKLASEQQVACQPRQQHTTSDPGIAAEMLQKLRQTQIGSDAGECDDTDVRQLNEAVGSRRKLRG